ncbi:Protein of unknown function DUF3435 [Penicillium cf. viridicatum]|uniref:Uncharacterized protein n=1 Tax=Penicillium cf. viridicatum TaxID=2972119 RepID=A0A9W9MKM1_9EURO|nr:Protein of unknown function DUF3435 [Penicillium cf. viridicatum]
MIYRTSQLSYTPYITAPISIPEPTPEQANYISSNLSIVGNFQQELAKRKLSTIEPSDISDSRDYENNSEPSQTSSLAVLPADGSLYIKIFSSSNDNKFQTPGTLPVDSYGYTVKVLETRSYQDKHKGRYSTQPYQKRKKRRPLTRPLSDLSESSVPILSYRSSTIQRLHRSTILTVESNTSLKPVYFFTFIPDASPILPLAHTAVIPPLKHTYTSDENTLLVRLKEKEAIS